jgi:hypothetical protein
MEQTKRHSIIVKAVREAILRDDPDAVLKLKSKDPNIEITLFGKSYTLSEAELVVSRMYSAIGVAINLYDMINEIDTINAIDEMIESGEICVNEEEVEQGAPAPLPVRNLDRFATKPFRTLNRFES